MPNIRIMTWNIDSLSWDKARIAGMVDAIARTVVSQRVDILIVVDVAANEVVQTMNAISRGMHNIAPGNDDFRIWCISQQTTGGHYGFFIRDANQIRPVSVVAGPTGANADRIQNLFASRFATWPGTFAAVANAYDHGDFPLVGPIQGPSQPLVDLYAAPPAVDPPPDQNPNEQAAAVPGAFTLGTGHRAPCMAFFEVLAGGGQANTLIPIVVCGYQGDEALAAGQLAQLKGLHVAQHFNRGDYINLNNTPRLITEIIVTGDFNVDFRRADPAGDELQQVRATGYRALSPTAPNGGSATPGALPGGPRPVPGTQGGMTFPFQAGEYPARVATNLIPPLALRVAASSESTRYKPLTVTTPPTELAALRDICGSNFFYGGTRCSAAAQVPCPAGAPAPGIPIPGGNSALMVDPANNIRLNNDPALEGALGLLDISDIARYYSDRDQLGARARPTLVATHPNPPNPPPAITIADQWVGARLISSNLPVVIQLNLP